MAPLLTKVERALSFGLPHIDNHSLGFRIGEFAVLYGHPLIKTLTFRLSVCCQLSTEDGGLNSTAIYLDGGNTFNPYAVSEAARQHDLDPRTTLERIFVSRAFTAYQLAALVFETLEDALKHYKSKLVLISDIMSLFLDSDVPTREALQIFNKALTYLSNLVTRRKVLVLASYFPCGHSKRRILLESILLGKATLVTRVQESKGLVQFSLERHPFLQPLVIDILPNATTLEKFAEA